MTVGSCQDIGEATVESFVGKIAETFSSFYCCIRYALPSRDNDQLCIIEIAVANGTANRQQKYMNEPVSEEGCIKWIEKWCSAPHSLVAFHPSLSCTTTVGMSLASSAAYVNCRWAPKSCMWWGKQSEAKTFRTVTLQSASTNPATMEEPVSADHVLDYSSASSGTQRTLRDSASDSCGAVILKDYKQLALNLNLNTSKHRDKRCGELDLRVSFALLR
ncbi:uncharacterized protein LOC107726583 [Sinocyclocheilus rhinocerous]|uniref:uncharacterized protein LOC107726583 n=1 Tax=Sinocyclocheilus rhinocerous TaxID=307959 RepID=UPI0007B7D3BB|nr:PREDICTED: uncharacterized protein LOC107726583 [Sinocyclocheilus rhinocerous]